MVRRGEERMLHPEVTGYLRKGLAGTIHGDAGDVEDFLIGFPQEPHQERRATSGLIYRPDDLLSERESVVYEPRVSASSFSTLLERSSVLEASST
jgi:hypothetical protein